MKREIMPDYAERFFMHPFSKSSSNSSKKHQKEAHYCVVAHRKVDFQSAGMYKDIWVAGGVKNLFNDEICMMAHVRR